MGPSARRCRRTSLVASLVVLVALTPGLGRALDDENASLRVELAPNGRATVVGTGTSVRTLLEDLCWKAGGVLRYDATDEPFSIALEDQPLERVIARLLRRQSYVLRMKTDPDGERRVGELHVLGAGGVAHRQLHAEHPAPAPGPASEPAAPVATAPEFFVPFAMLEASFGAPDDASRETALRRLIDDVRTDPLRLRSFLAADPDALRNALLRYPDAARMLRSVRASPGLDPAIGAKLDELIARLE